MNQLDSQELQLNTYVAVKIASDLYEATNLTTALHGADLMVTEQLVTKLLNYETTLSGLNLTHSQDKDYIQVCIIVYSLF